MNLYQKYEARLNAVSATAEVTPRARRRPRVLPPSLDLPVLRMLSVTHQSITTNLLLPCHQLPHNDKLHREVQRTITTSLRSLDPSTGTSLDPRSTDQLPYRSTHTFLLRSNSKTTSPLPLVVVANPMQSPPSSHIPRFGYHHLNLRASTLIISNNLIYLLSTHRHGIPTRFSITLPPPSLPWDPTFKSFAYHTPQHQHDRIFSNSISTSNLTLHLISKTPSSSNVLDSLIRNPCLFSTRVSECSTLHCLTLLPPHDKSSTLPLPTHKHSTLPNISFQQVVIRVQEIHPSDTFLTLENRTNLGSSTLSNSSGERGTSLNRSYRQTTGCLLLVLREVDDREVGPGDGLRRGGRCEDFALRGRKGAEEDKEKQWY